MDPAGRNVGAALRGRPRLSKRIQESDNLGFGEHDKPRAATEGRLQYVPSIYIERDGRVAGGLTIGSGVSLDL